jgi:hypothetical protein
MQRWHLAGQERVEPQVPTRLLRSTLAVRALRQPSSSAMMVSVGKLSAVKVEKDGHTLSVRRPVLPDLQVSADGLRGFVRFTVDVSDPLSTPLKFARMQGFPELNLTRENAPAVLRELQVKRRSFSDNDPGLPKIIVQIAWVKKYLEARSVNGVGG